MRDRKRGISGRIGAVFLRDQLGIRRDSRVRRFELIIEERKPLTVGELGVEGRVLP